MKLPEYRGLYVGLLASCFNNTSATYKFYWFLAILDEVERGRMSIQKGTLFARMVAHAWYTVNYFHVSFGKQDKLQTAIAEILKSERISVNAGYHVVADKLSMTANKTTLKTLWHFNCEVPHRFLSPWFGKKVENRDWMYEQSRNFERGHLYALCPDEIKINPNWIDYLERNAGILRDFCYWNLTMYVQSKNPNVPDIPNKLIRQPIRRGLNEQKNFWKFALKELGGVRCIYTDNLLLAESRYVMEHFVPYAFVAHDLIWNLIPADESFNSKKADRLPPLDLYFEPFFNLQQQAVNVFRQKAPRHKLLADYLTIFPQFDDRSIEREKFYDQLLPLITIASNNGFQFMNKD